MVPAIPTHRRSEPDSVIQGANQYCKDRAEQYLHKYKNELQQDLNMIVFNKLMYYHIHSIKNQFKHNSNSKLLFGVAVAQRRALLFYSNGMFYQYDLYDKKILYTSNIGQKPCKASAVGPQEIVSILPNSKTLVSIDIKKKSINELIKLPVVPSKDEIKDRSLIICCNIVVFNKSGMFYVEETNDEQNKKRIIFFYSSREKPIIKDYEYNNYVFEKADEQNKLVIYKQKIESLLEIRVINLADNFSQARYIVEHKLFTTTTLIGQVIFKKQNEILIFVNSPLPSILIFDIQSLTTKEFLWKPTYHFRNVCYYDHEKQVACLVYLCNNRINGELYENMLQLIDIDREALICRKYITLKEYSLGWERDFLLDIAPQYKTGNVSIFHTRHFIKKKSLYFNLMNKATTVLQKYGMDIGRYVLELLQ